MKSIEIGKSAVVASQAALGVMRMDALDADAAAEVVRTAAEHGVNFFDTADIYGFNVNHDHASSRVLGRAWKDAGLKREDIFLQTKFGINIDFSDPNNVHATRYDFSAKHLITRLDEELEALGTDYVDFALLHRPDTLMEAEEIVEAFTTLHKAGKVRHFGVSNVNPWQAELLQSWLGDDPAMRLEASQLQFGLMHAQMVSDELMTNSGAEGTYRFLRRIWNWAFAKKNLIASAGALEGQMLPHDAKTLRREVHTTLRQAEYDFSRMQYNTVVSACMKMFNTIEGFKGETPADLAALCECASILLRTLYPIAPHITTALWQELGFVERIGDLIDAPWPEVSEDAIKADELKLVVQVNGKLRGEILVPAEAAQAEIEAAALANPDVQRFTEGMTVRKIIIVKNKLVNVVVAK